MTPRFALNTPVNTVMCVQSRQSSRKLTVFAGIADEIDSKLNSAFMAVERLTELVTMSASDDAPPCFVDFTKMNKYNSVTSYDSIQVPLLVRGTAVERRSLVGELSLYDTIRYGRLTTDQKLTRWPA